MLGYSRAQDTIFVEKSSPTIMSRQLWGTKQSLEEVASAWKFNFFRTLSRWTSSNADREPIEWSTGPFVRWPGFLSGGYAITLLGRKMCIAEESELGTLLALCLTLSGTTMFRLNPWPHPALLSPSRRHASSENALRVCSVILPWKHSFHHEDEADIGSEHWSLGPSFYDRKLIAFPIIQRYRQAGVAKFERILFRPSLVQLMILLVRVVKWRLDLSIL